MRMSDWSSDVCASDLLDGVGGEAAGMRRDIAVEALRPGGERLVAQPEGVADLVQRHHPGIPPGGQRAGVVEEIGRESCRERVCRSVWLSVVAVSYKQKMQT